MLINCHIHTFYMEISTTNKASNAVMRFCDIFMACTRKIFFLFGWHYNYGLRRSQRRINKLATTCMHVYDAIIIDALFCFVLIKTVNNFTSI